MDIINIKFDQTDVEIGSLGMQGENNKVALHVDCSGVLEKHPGATIIINYDRRFPGESYYNLPVTALGDGIYEAVLTPMEMAYDGLKYIQIRAVEGDYEDRSRRFIGYVEKSVYDFRPPTGPVSDWLDQLKDALSKAESAQQHGPVIGENGNWCVWQDGAHVDTGVAAGSDISEEMIAQAVHEYLAENPVTGGGGLTTAQITALDSMFKVAAYTKADVSIEYAAFKAAFGIEDSGEEEPDTPVVTTYSIINELVNLTSNNSATSVEENAAYTAALTAAEGYTLTGAAVTVLMGGEDITATAYADGVITIAAVTGNVEIIASAAEEEVEVNAELPADGLLSYFDFRTTEYNNNASSGLTTIAPTQGSGQLFVWANNSISEQNDYGLVPANTRGWMYDKDGGTTQTELGTAFTVVSLTYAETPSFGFNYANGGSKWTFYPKYVNASGSQANAEQRNGSLFNSDSKDDYNFCVYRVDGATLTEIFDTSRTEYDGGSIDGFSKWLDKVNGSVSNISVSGVSHTAMAIYNRALTDVEIEEARAFMKTLEVTA